MRFKRNYIELTINKEQLNNILGMTSKEIKETFFKDISSIDKFMNQCEQGGTLYPDIVETFLEYYNISHLFKDI